MILLTWMNQNHSNHFLVFLVNFVYQNGPCSLLYNIFGRFSHRFSLFATYWAALIPDSIAPSIYPVETVANSVPAQ